jgi:hypothetical protein
VERIWWGLYEHACGHCRTAHFLVRENNGKYCFISSGARVNYHTLAASGIPPNHEEFSEGFTGLPISSLIDFRGGYDQKMLRKDRQDYMPFQTTQGMYQMTRQLDGATNSVSAFDRVSWKVIVTQLGSIAEILVHYDGVNGPKSQFGQEEAEGQYGVPRIVMEYLQNLNNVLADGPTAAAKISREKPNWRWIGVKLVWFVSGEAGRWLQASRVDKV